MSRLDVAAQRLSAALDTLEERAAPFGRVQETLAAHARELSALTSERDKLLAKIAELEDETSALSGTSEAIEARIDGAIAEIRAALAH